jgi:predicted DNA-binding WGR domain protein
MSTLKKAVATAYAGQSELQLQDGQARIGLVLDGSRGTVGLRGTVAAPALLRDALMTTFDVLGSDFRYQRKDLATYLAYLTKQGKKANKEIWEAQKAYLEQQLGQEEEPDQVLEPLVTIDPDAFSLEVFSADQSSYARLAISATQFSQRAAAHGSATLAITQAFIDRFERLRSWQPAEFTAATDAQADTSATSTHKTRLVPLAWLRNFVQVQAAATLPAVVASLEPIDLYNLLFILRTRAARKPPRGIRFELVPGVRPRLVIEPFEIVLECHGEVYSGSTPRVIRIFGRQRLLALARALPHAHSVKVHLLGAGLPIFWVLDFGAERGQLTVGYTGWTDSGWSSASAFDALMPAPSIAPLALRAFTYLCEHGPTALDAMVKALGASATDVRAALQYESIKGRVLYDLARGEYRPRLLLAEPIDVASIRFGGERESLAHRLLGDEAKPSGHVRITKLHDLGDESVEISGEVEDTLARRTFAPRFVLDGEGRVRGASCSCLHFKRSGMREGPCEHLLALRIHHQRQQLLDEAARNTAEGRALIRAETRTLIRRRGMKEVVYRVSLDQRLVQVDWGQRGATARQQRTWFESDGAAREAYFARLSALNAEGYIDQRTES